MDYLSIRGGWVDPSGHPEIPVRPDADGRRSGRPAHELARVIRGVTVGGAVGVGVCWVVVYGALCVVAEPGRRLAWSIWLTVTIMALPVTTYSVWRYTQGRRAGRIADALHDPNARSSRS